MTLDKIYYDPKHPAAFGGARRLLEAVENKSDVKKWLQGERTYTLHKASRKRYNTRRYKVKAPHWLWQTDLVEMISYANVNKGYRYLLTVIDVFSRKAWARPIKRKTGTNITDAFKDIIQQERQSPKRLQSDDGKEFKNATFQHYLRTLGTTHFTIKSQFKAALVERWNRTLKEKMWRYFTYTGTYKWLDILQDLVSAYNDATHRSLNGGKMTPNQATDPHNTHMLWLQQEGLAPQRVTFKPPPAVPMLAINDYVRISKAKQVFEKGYLPNWTEEIFKISTIDKFKPTEYKLVDLLAREILGSFYRDELQKVDLPVTFMVEHIIRKRKKNSNQMEYLVKWLGYGPEFNSWVLHIDKQTAARRLPIE